MCYYQRETLRNADKEKSHKIGVLPNFMGCKNRCFLSQVELAEKAGVIARTIQNYEHGSRKPSNMVTIQKITDVLNTTTEYLLGSSGTYVVEAHEKGGAKEQKILKSWSVR